MGVFGSSIGQWQSSLFDSRYDGLRALHPLHPPSYAGHMRVDLLDAHSKKAVSLCLLLAAASCLLALCERPLKPPPGRTPFLSPSPLVCVLDQPRLSVTSPPPPHSPGRSSWKCLEVPPALFGTDRPRWDSPSSSICSLLPAADHRLALLHHLLPSFPCSLLPARQPVCAQPFSLAKPSARRYSRSQKALITSGPRAAIQHGQLPPASRERHSQPHSATLISRRRRAGTSTYYI